MSGEEEEVLVIEEPTTAIECANGDDYDRAELPELLRIYYSRVFPYDKYYDWLEYGKTIHTLWPYTYTVPHSCTYVRTAYRNTSLRLRLTVQPYRDAPLTL